MCPKFSYIARLFYPLLIALKMTLQAIPMDKYQAKVNNNNEVTVSLQLIYIRYLPKGKADSISESS